MSATLTTPVVSTCDEAARAALARELEAEERRLRRHGEAPLDRTLRWAGTLSVLAGHNPLTGQPYYTTEDVLGWIVQAVSMGCAEPRLGPETLADVAHLVRVPNAKLREAYIARAQAEDDAEGLLARIATALGLVRQRPGGGGDADTTAVLRLLGIAPKAFSKDYPPSLQVLCTYEQAVAIADVLDLDYHSIGV